MAASSLLAGKVALVTGGASGIGRATCELLAKNGASIAVVDCVHDGAHKTLESLTPIDGHAHKLFVTDVGNSSAVRDLVAEVTKAFDKPPSILVNSAGITRDQLLVRMKEEEWDEVINVNLKGTFLMAQAVSQALIQSHTAEGSFINISSISGKIGNIGQTNYSASKAGVIGMTKAMAKELSRYKIRCNAILPGFIKTPMTDKMPEKIIKMFLQTVPLGTVGKPEDIAEACLFLASPKSSYITGACIEVAGGLAI